MTRQTPLNVDYSTLRLTVVSLLSRKCFIEANETRPMPPTYPPMLCSVDSLELIEAERTECVAPVPKRRATGARCASFARTRTTSNDSRQRRDAGGTSRGTMMVVHARAPKRKAGRVAIGTRYRKVNFTFL